MKDKKIIEISPPQGEEPDFEEMGRQIALEIQVRLNFVSMTEMEQREWMWRHQVRSFH